MKCAADTKNELNEDKKNPPKMRVSPTNQAKRRGGCDAWIILTLDR